MYQNMRNRDGSQMKLRQQQTIPPILRIPTTLDLFSTTACFLALMFSLCNPF